ncbi:unnamed protein product, partial [Diamesa serratosioi]
MKTLIIFLVIIAASVAIARTLEEVNKLEEWKAKHKTSYKSPEERLKREGNVIKRMRNIKRHNERYKRGESSYKLKLNRFSDQTPAELTKKKCGLKVPKQLRTFPVGKIIPNNFPISTKTFLNYTAEGRVLPVLRQGDCGSCWAFSSVGVLEGVFTKKYPGFDTPLSQQYLLDCSMTEGCSGGWPQAALDYVILNGIPSNETVPYNETVLLCDTTVQMVPEIITNSVLIRLKGNERKLRNIVAFVGPVSIGMSVQEDFYDYNGGIYDNKACPSNEDSINHAVLLVGYGKDELTGIDYWLVKNSWGTDWGELGYVRMIRNSDNQCGIAQYAFY